MQKSFKNTKPTLYVVSTPIGNLKDITLRALEILNEVDLILAEDTRTSGVLLSHYEIKKPMISYHEFNKSAQEGQIINLLDEGKNIALISDAGTPGISDPGYEIIMAVIEHDYHVVSIPGPSAILAALVVSGLVMQPFTFIGFLPRKASDAKGIIESYKERAETLIIYESPLRIGKTLNLLHEILGNRNIALARELTKAFETIIRTTLLTAITFDHNPKGEYVIVIEGGTKIVDLSITITEQVDIYIQQGLTEKDAMKAVAKERNITKSEVYKAFKIEE